MSVSLRNEGRIALLAIDGKLALGDSLDEFRTKWADATATGAKDVIVNFSKVPMVDSSGIGSLIRCHSALVASGGKLKLVAVNDVVRQSFKTTRLDRVFEFYNDESSALASFGASA